MTGYPLGSRVKHASKGEGVIIADSGSSYRIYFNAEETLEIGKGFAGLEIVELAQAPPPQIDMEIVEEALENVLKRFSDIGKSELHSRWLKGNLVFEPNNPSLKEHEIPIETFFHKIVMLRDRLRVLEQNINSQEKLDDADKVHLQQYITKIYGSLTSFNFLFRDKNDQFVGEGKKD